MPARWCRCGCAAAGASVADFCSGSAPGVLSRLASRPDGLPPGSEAPTRPARHAGSAQRGGAATDDTRSGTVTITVGPSIMTAVEVAGVDEADGPVVSGADSDPPAQPDSGIRMQAAISDRPTTRAPVTGGPERPAHPAPPDEWSNPRRVGQGVPGHRGLDRRARQDPLDRHLALLAVHGVRDRRHRRHRTGDVPGRQLLADQGAQRGDDAGARRHRRLGRAPRTATGPPPPTRSTCPPPASRAPAAPTRPPGRTPRCPSGRRPGSAWHPTGPRSHTTRGR